PWWDWIRMYCSTVAAGPGSTRPRAPGKASMRPSARWSTRTSRWRRRNASSCASWWRHWPRRARATAEPASSRRLSIRAGNIVGPEWRLSMNALMKAAGWIAAGAAVMYFLDPQTGRRRRALARDRGAGAVRELEHSARAAGRDASNRMRGAVAEAGSHMDDAPVADGTLDDRIRAKLGHLMDRPSAVEVTVNGGHVTLSGEATDEEAAEVARYVAGMQGVSDVESRLSSPPLSS